jgi:hypothetical protein
MARHRSEHPEDVPGCFGCKLIGLQINTGDAGRSHAPMSQKKWDAELQAYRDARSQGIQPAGTTAKAVKESLDASDKLGMAYNAETMPAAARITERAAETIKEVGAL